MDSVQLKHWLYQTQLLSFTLSWTWQKSNFQGLDPSAVKPLPWFFLTAEVSMTARSHLKVLLIVTIASSRDT